MLSVFDLLINQANDHLERRVEEGRHLFPDEFSHIVARQNLPISRSSLIETNLENITVESSAS